MENKKDLIQRQVDEMIREYKISHPSEKVKEVLKIKPMDLEQLYKDSLNFPMMKIADLLIKNNVTRNRYYYFTKGKVDLKKYREIMLDIKYSQK